MGKRHFYWAWAKGALLRAYGLGDAISGGVGFVTGVAAHYYPSLEAISQAYAWSIPVYTLAAAMAFRIVITPFELWKRETDKVQALAQEDLPKFNTQVGQAIWGGRLPDGNQIMLLPLTLANVGSRASALLGWSISISRDGVEIAGIISASPNLRLNLIGINGTSHVVTQDQFIYSRASKAIAVGETADGYLFAVFPDGSLDLPAALDVSFTYNDVFGGVWGERHLALHGGDNGQVTYLPQAHGGKA